jgi:3-isopropylmalate/(R)-2-methylmalate dehydratase large subunit
MALTYAEKILAAHSGRERVLPGELIEAEIDLALANEITGPAAADEFRRTGAGRVWDRRRVALLPDHFTPSSNIKAAELCRRMREFAREQDIELYYEVGRCGVEHAFLPEQGIVRPGDLVIGADSHTVTYGGIGAFSTGVGHTDLGAALAMGSSWFRVPKTLRFNLHGSLPPWVGGKDLILYTIGQIGVDGARYAAMEFGGQAVAELSVEGRLTMANMAIEAGGKAGLFPPDAKTWTYVDSRPARNFEQRGRRLARHELAPDAGAAYARVNDWDVSGLRPQVALPHLPSNVRPVDEVKGVRIDQAFIGSCTNGRYEDLAVAAGVLRGRRVAPHVRLIVLPATPAIWRRAMRDGLFEVFLDAGASVGPPSCGPCFGGSLGVLAPAERCVSTSNRNFVGRMGHNTSEVYLAGPAVAAASAVAGEIVAPEVVAGERVPPAAVTGERVPPEAVAGERVPPGAVAGYGGGDR